MGRPRKFERQDALLEALRVFWARGYEATSMTDLQKALGIGRQSLYSTFGDKDQLFEEALQLYIAMSDKLIASRFDGTCGLAEVRAHLYEAIARLTSPEPRNGCFVTNSCIELAARGGPAAVLVAGSFERMNGCFTRALQNAADAGELAPHVSVSGAAYSLTLLNTGIMVQVKNGATAEMLTAAVDNTLAGLVPQT